MIKDCSLLGEERSSYILSSKMSKIVVSLLLFVIMIPWFYLSIFVVYHQNNKIALYLMIMPGFIITIIGLLSLLYGIRQKKIKIYSNGFTNPKLHLFPIKQADFIFWKEIIAIEYGKYGINEYYILTQENGKKLLLASSIFQEDEWIDISMTIEKIRENIN